MAYKGAVGIAATTITMKRLSLLILILALAISPLYADEAQPEETTTEVSEETTTEVESQETESVSTKPETGEPPEVGVGGSLTSFLQESFQTDLATGAATMSIPITVPPGRKNMQPNIALSYSSNNSNGILGVGWAIPINTIQRSTKKGVPTYTNEDTFIFSGAGSSAELAPINEENTEYRAKIESAFMKYIYDASNNTWTVHDKSGAKYTFGSTDSSTSRLEGSKGTFSWYLKEVRDVYENYITYIYEQSEGGAIYPTKIEYTGGTGLNPDKSVEFIYDATREDKLTSFRTGWQITTDILLTEIHVKLNTALVWRYELKYIVSNSTNRSLLQEVTVYDAGGNSLPSKKFTYQGLED